jgi:hypothetical protein
MNITLGDITGVAALLLTLILIAKGYLEGRNLQKVSGNLDADSISKLQITLNEAITTNASLSKQVSEFKQELEHQKRLHVREMEEQKKLHLIEMGKLQKMYDDVLEWSEHLCDQIRSYGGEPIKMKGKTKPAV